MAKIGHLTVTVRVDNLAKRQLHAYTHQEKLRCRLAQFVYRAAFALGDRIDPPGQHSTNEVVDDDDDLRKRGNG